MIKYLVMDVDGTLTDGSIIMGQNGELFKRFSAKDGYGIKPIAIENGLIPVVLTSRESDIVSNRCAELDITEVYQGAENKAEKLQEIIDDISQVAYIGDDLNDLDAMLVVKKAGGIVAAPADASPEILAIADYICEKTGGHGAVREFIEWIIK